jgi:hypothetical protein
MGVPAEAAGDAEALNSMLSFPKNYSQFGKAGVARWEGVSADAVAASDALVRAQRPAFKRRVTDTWDEDYDRGKMKKKRAAKEALDGAAENLFDSQGAARRARGPLAHRGGPKRGAGAVRQEQKKAGKKGKRRHD